MWSLPDPKTHINPACPHPRATVTLQFLSSTRLSMSPHLVMLESLSSIHLSMSLPLVTPQSLSSIRLSLDEDLVNLFTFFFAFVYDFNSLFSCLLSLFLVCLRQPPPFCLCLSVFLSICLCVCVSVCLYVSLSCL